ncbi:MAG: hypothetical protein LBP22_13755 [Deltaproteobacteria bacterium]|jgi:hypothetical protein|nr:hypothetical protein [Deltaproteobacteria bacterium]
MPVHLADFQVQGVYFQFQAVFKIIRPLADFVKLLNEISLAGRLGLIG